MCFYMRWKGGRKGEVLCTDGGVWDGIGGRRKEDISTVSLDELGSLGGGCVAGRC